MKNLWLFLVRYNAVFWFILFFGFSLLLVARYNSFQRSAFVNSSNIVAGSFYDKTNGWKKYLSLTSANEQLVAENVRLREQIENLTALDSNEYVDSAAPIDAVESARYQFIAAGVVNNSIHQKSNYITLNKGTKDGISKGMGVITSNGVVGIVLNVSRHFSTVKSLLHPDTRISVSLDSSNTAFGSLVWGSNISPRYAMIRDIPNHVKLYVGQPVFTSGYSTLFPKGIKVGYVLQTDVASGESFKDIRVLLTTDFSSLHHVYIVKDRMAEEKLLLEEENQNDG